MTQPSPAPTCVQHPYYGQRIAFLTQHGKEIVVAPAFLDTLGCHVERVTGFDTDELGSFTRDIPRYGSQLDAARRKARIGMDLSGATLGIASEGSFGPDPHTGMFPWNMEVLIFIDDVRKTEVIGFYEGPANSDTSSINDWSALEAFANRVGFPSQQLVIRPVNEHDPRIRKGLATMADLRDAFSWAKACAADSAKETVFVERDLRAHAHPERMQNIGRAAHNLLEKLCSLCPQCQTPGYAATKNITGLPCTACRRPTQESKGRVWSCPSCDYTENRPREDGRTTADPARCDYCNP